MKLKRFTLVGIITLASCSEQPKQTEGVEGGQTVADRAACSFGQHALQTTTVTTARLSVFSPGIWTRFYHLICPSTMVNLGKLTGME